MHSLFLPKTNSFQSPGGASMSVFVEMWAISVLFVHFFIEKATMHKHANLYGTFFRRSGLKRILTKAKLLLAWHLEASCRHPDTYCIIRTNFSWKMLADIVWCSAYSGFCWRQRVIREFCFEKWSTKLDNLIQFKWHHILLVSCAPCIFPAVLFVASWLCLSVRVCMCVRVCVRACVCACVSVGDFFSITCIWGFFTEVSTCVCSHSFVSGHLVPIFVDKFKFPWDLPESFFVFCKAYTEQKMKNTQRKQQICNQTEIRFLLRQKDKRNLAKEKNVQSKMRKEWTELFCEMWLKLPRLHVKWLLFLDVSCWEVEAWRAKTRDEDPEVWHESRYTELLSKYV